MIHKDDSVIGASLAIGVQGIKETVLSEQVK